MQVHTFATSKRAGHAAWILLSIALLMMFTINALDFPYTVPYIQRITGGAGLPDTKLSYTPDELYRTLDLLHSAGRHAYERFLITFDAVFPLLYSTALYLVARFLVERGFPQYRWARYLCLTALTAGLFDYLENGMILFLLGSYPEPSNQIAILAGSFTLLKWVFSWFILLIIAAGGIRTIFFRRKAS